MVREDLPSQTAQTDPRRLLFAFRCQPDDAFEGNRRKGRETCVPWSRAQDYSLNFQHLPAADGAGSQRWREVPAGKCEKRDDQLFAEATFLLGLELNLCKSRLAAIIVYSPNVIRN